MDIPQPPQDTELRNIIDKLAQFVARNGPEFEQMTKTKQKNNPKFQFLYGGEYFKYYEYKISTEQAMLRQQAAITNPPGTNPPAPWNPQPVATMDQLTQQQEALREQIRQSEHNLTAQHTVLMQQQQSQVDGLVSKLELSELQNRANESHIVLSELESLLQPIIDSCTKDSISTGKGWILQHATTQHQAECIAFCLLLKVIQGNVPFLHKLHIIYLVNDVLHHCARKNADELKKALENVVVPMFCNAKMSATEEQSNKLEKLLKLWESKANYIAPDTVEKLKNPSLSYQQFQATQVAKYANEVASLVQQTKATFDGYQAQHQAFVSHAMQQIVSFEQQKQSLEVQNQTVPTSASHTPQSQSALFQNSINQITTSADNSLLLQNNQNILSEQTAVSKQNSLQIQTIPQSEPEDNGYLPHINPSIPPPIAPQVAQPSNGLEPPPAFSQPPPGFFPPPGVGVFPDFSKPPPGFVPPKPEPPEELLPSVPYYDLPAGLMVPLIKLEDFGYKPLDPKAIRLPAPAPPSDRLLAAVEAFYAPPSHERPRDSDGWEKLGLYEYYKAKNTAKKQKDDQIEMGMREKSRSPSPIVMPIAKSPSPPKRRYQSRSPSPRHSESSRRSRSRSPPRRRKSRSRRRRSDSRSRSRSPSRELSRESSRDAVTHRSPTPPSFRLLKLSLEC